MEPPNQSEESLIIQLFNAQSDSVVWFTPVYKNGQRMDIIDFKCAYCNEAACKFINADRRDVLGSTLLTTPLMDEESMKIVYEQCLDTWAKEETKEFTYYSPKLAKYFTVQHSKVANGILRITRDKTREVSAERERDHNEDVIREQAQLLDLILNSSLNGIYTLNTVRDARNEIVDFEMTHTNDVFCRMSGKSREQLIGKSYLQTFPHTLTAGIFKRNCEVINTGKHYEQESHYEGDGVDLWFNSSVVKLSDEKIVISFNDITNLKKVMVQLENSNVELKKSNERLSEFTQVAAHDLNEPLRKIRTFADLLAERYDDKLEPGMKEYLGKIDKTVGRMQTLLNNLLAYSKVSNISRNFEIVSLNDVVREVQIDLETTIKKKQVKLSVSELPSIIGDETQLRQIFQNLISNAIKFQKQNVTPTISISQKRESETNGKPYVVIEIEDNGIGFDQTYADKIFQLFLRLHSKDEYEGTGIGLTIVQKAMENHNGYIEVKSEQGKGSCFKLFFPKVVGEMQLQTF